MAHDLESIGKRLNMATESKKYSPKVAVVMAGLVVIVMLLGFRLPRWRVELNGRASRVTRGSL
jgi:hypothetical protein